MHVVWTTLWGDRQKSDQRVTWVGLHPLPLSMNWLRSNHSGKVEFWRHPSAWVRAFACSALCASVSPHPRTQRKPRGTSDRLISFSFSAFALSTHVRLATYSRFVPRVTMTGHCNGCTWNVQVRNMTADLSWTYKFDFLQPFKKFKLVKVLYSGMVFTQSFNALQSRHMW